MRARFRTVASALLLGLPWLASHLPAQGTWRQVAGMGPSHENGGLCYDRTRGELVRFNYPLETWVNDGDRWERRPVTSGPPSRSFTMMACDEARGVVVLASGDGRFDTWEWNGQTWTSRGTDLAIQSNGGGMGYDRVRQRVVLVTDAYRTFEWDGAAWTLRSTFWGPVVSMAWDDTRNRLVGLNYAGLVAYDGTNWQPIAGSAVPSGPSGGELHLTFDQRRQKLVVVRSRVPTTEVLEWNGTQWNLVPTTFGPGLHYGPRVAYDSNRGRVVFGGGEMAYASPCEFWEWDGLAWTRRDGSPLPGRPIGAAYDPVRQRTVLHGTLNINLSPRTYEWDGHHWATTNPPNPLPGFVAGPMAFDELRQRTTLIADITTGLATYDWDGADWTLRTTANAPSSRSGYAIAYDGARQETVLFGGVFRNETWRLSGATWSQATPATVPSARNDHAMAYDPVRQRLVMFGGQTVDTWEWDGTNWTRRFPTTSPSFRLGQAMTWDPQRSRIALTGGLYYVGTTPTARPPEVWEWNGTNWSLRSTSGLLGTAYHVFVHDGTGLLVHAGSRAFTGSTGLDSTSETLRLNDAPLAAATTYGVGCAGTTHELLIDAQFVPYLGNPGFAVRLTNAEPQTAALLAYATGAANLPLGGSCAQLVDPVLASEFRLTTVGGEASFGVPIPNDLGLLGVALFAQGATLGVGGPFAGIQLSRGLRFDLGW